MLFLILWRCHNWFLFAQADCLEKSSSSRGQSSKPLISQGICTPVVSLCSNEDIGIAPQHGLITWIFTQGLSSQRSLQLQRYQYFNYCPQSQLSSVKMSCSHTLDCSAALSLDKICDFNIRKIGISRGSHRLCHLLRRHMHRLLKFAFLPMMLPVLLGSHTIIYCLVQMWSIRWLSYLTAHCHWTQLSYSSSPCCSQQRDCALLSQAWQRYNIPQQFFSWANWKKSVHLL